MIKTQLIEKLHTKKAKIAIIGLGYVGFTSRPTLR